MPTGIYVRHPKPIKWHREGDCFRCTSHAMGSHGYVAIWRDSQLFTIPRLILRNRGQATKELEAMHSCDNRWCINPAHISAGTRSQHLRDEYSRKVRTPRGYQKGHPYYSGRWRITKNYTP